MARGPDAKEVTALSQGRLSPEKDLRCLLHHPPWYRRYWNGARNRPGNHDQPWRINPAGPFRQGRRVRGIIPGRL